VKIEAIKHRGSIMKKDYEIGYGKPPVAKQFTKGQGPHVKTSLQPKTAA